MFNLYELLQTAHGGQAAENLAKQFGISPEQAEAVMQAVTPALSSGFQANMMNPAAFGSFLGAMGNPNYQAAYNDPNAASAAATENQGNDLLAQMFGPQALEPMAKQAAALSGLSPQVIQRMLPVLASMLMGGFLSAMQQKGFGGLFDQLTKGGAGGFGSIFGQMFGNAAAPAPQQQPQTEPTGQAPASGGGLGDLLGSVLSQAFGGQRPGNWQGQQAPTGMPSMPGFDPATVQAGFEALSKMFQPGAGATPARAASDSPGENLSEEIGDILSNKKR